MTPPKRPAAAQPSTAGRWRSAGTTTPQGLIVSGLTPTGGTASGPAKPDPRRLLGERHSVLASLDTRQRGGLKAPAGRTLLP